MKKEKQEIAIYQIAKIKSLGIATGVAHFIALTKK
jgi:hypothetical protein